MRCPNVILRTLCPTIIALLLLAACSTTARLPAGERLYTGIRKVEIDNYRPSQEADEVLAEIETALAYPPNNAFFGSSSVRTPLPIGLWAYNAWAGKTDPVSRRLYRMFAAEPVLISTVNPEIRTRIAENLLREHGYFGGTAGYEIVVDRRDSLKAEVVYRIAPGEPHRYDSIEFRPFGNPADSQLIADQQRLTLKRGDQFNVVRMEEERQRIAALLRSNGYFYFRPEYIVYEADSSMRPGGIALRIRLMPDLPQQALQPWTIGQLHVNLSDQPGETLTDTLHHRDMLLAYRPPLRVRPRILYRRFRFNKGERYSQTRQTQTQEGLSQMSAFRYADMQFVPRDSSGINDTLDVAVNAIYDLPLNGEAEINLTANSNRRFGPGAVVAMTRNNILGGGEALTIKLNGTYEWLYGDRSGTGTSMDNYEYGLTSTLVFPRVLLPAFMRKDFDFPASTTFQSHINRQNRAEFFRIMSFGGSATYDFRPNRIRRHSFTPIRLAFNRLENTTARFDSLAQRNTALFQSLRNQLIPAISYTYTLDNSTVRKGRHTTWWQFSVTESGNIASALFALAGRSFDEEKKILGIPFSQFLKVTTELRYNRVVDRNHRLVARLAAGVIYSYGNSRMSPYTEQFYVGGANSIRAFPIRSLGPGRFARNADSPYATFDHAGDLRFEANLEHRFRLAGSLEGALFVDIGNIWMLRPDAETGREGGQLRWNHLLNDLATGTGFGFRYNMDVLVIRFDVGIGIHLPYDTGRRGYYNIPRFGDGLGLHFAVGYPF